MTWYEIYYMVLRMELVILIFTHQVPQIKKHVLNNFWSKTIHLRQSIQFSSFQSLSCPIFCNPIDCSTLKASLLFITNFLSLLKLMSNELV